MGRRGLFLLFNVIISIIVAFVVISAFSPDSNNAGGPERLVTFVVQITSTPNPNPPTPWIITTTPLPGEQALAVIPDAVRDGTAAPNVPVATIDPDILSQGGDVLFQNLPEGCITHVIQDGEFPSLIATIYDVSLPELLLVNNLTEETSVLLQIGEILIIPIDGCPIEAFIQNSDTEEATSITEEAIEEAGITDGEATEEPTPEVTPTITLAPTAANAQVEITDVIGAGDITTESVTIRNNGSVIDISGWTLSDGDGNTFVFPEGRRLFSGGEIIINTRIGENTTILFFWGRDRAAFGEQGDVITLADRQGNVQASLRLNSQ